MNPDAESFDPGAGAGAASGTGAGTGAAAEAGAVAGIVASAGAGAAGGGGTAMRSDGERLVGRSILLGVSGGVAAYKAAVLVRELQRAGASLQVVMTEAATHFVSPVTFQALSGNAVYIDQWDARIDNNMAHIELSRRADAIVVAPASADFIGNLAQGLCPDLLTTLCLARECPLLVAPAMNRQMWNHPATRRNVARLREDGALLLGPGTGEQACGETGDGRMLEPEDIVEELISWFAPKVLAGRRILMTAGPTYEAIDPVRGITNRSSGRMGYALARAFRHAGAQVTMVSGPTHMPTPGGVKVIHAHSAQQMLAAVESELEVAASSIRIDAFVAVAAVADWRPAEVSARKIKKLGTEDAAPPELRLVQNTDILATVAARSDAPFCLGFAAESDNLIQHATEKRLRKNIPLIAANIGPQTFGLNENEIVLIDDQGLTSLGRASKETLALRLTHELARRLPDSAAL